MPKTHTVKSGEHLAAIAFREGFGDTDRILQHPDNVAVAGRSHPALLDPGDELTIPDRVPATFAVKTGQIHKFVVRRPKVKLKVSFRTFQGGVTAATDAEVTLAGGAPAPVTLETGAIDVSVPDPRCASAVVTVSEFAEAEPHLRWELRLGDLVRGESDDGALGRLRNLGYYRAVSADVDPRERRSAIEEFQANQGMPLSGRLDDATKAKIAEIYGC